MKEITDPLRTIIEYIFMTLYNGSRALLNQMLVIDKSFLKQVLNHGDGIIQQILIFTIVCCCVIVVLATLLLPYFYSLYTTQKKIVEFVCLTDKLIMEILTTACKEFKVYL